MPFATWWRGDPLPALPPLASISARRDAERALVEKLTGLPPTEIVRRLQAGDDVYVAFLGEEPVTFGWVAKRLGAIAELSFAFALPPGNGYLWDFVTLPDWRGRGVYPHLLQAIIRQEGAGGIEHFWIGYELGNDASARGITRAGFQEVGDLVVEDDRVTGLMLYGTGERGAALREIFERALTEET